MKTFHTTNYKLYNDKTNTEFRICILNDLHFNEFTSDEKLQMILKKLEQVNPNYILFPGDLLDKADDIKVIKEKRRIILFLKDISNIAPLLISLGSHDYCIADNVINETGTRWRESFPMEFFEEVNNLNNVRVLHNSTFLDNQIYVLGYTGSFNYYNPIYDKEIKMFDKRAEDKSLMLQELKSLKQTIEDIPNDKLNFLMAHSPTYLKDREITDELKEFDYFVSGHMHNGLVPPILNEIWKSSHGIISPSRILLADNCRNTLKFNDDKLIVNGQLTTFHESHGFLSKFNFLYPSFITVIDFTKDMEYDTNKVYVKRHYGK